MNRNISVVVKDPNTNFEISYSMDYRLKKNIDNKVIPALQKKDKDYVICIDGGEGCLAGDTEIQISRLKLSRRYKIERLYNNYRGLNKKWKINEPSFVRSFNGKEIRLHKIKNVTYSGIKKVYLLTLENGLSIKATAEHKFMTNKGFIPLCNLKDELIMCDTLNPEKSNRKRIKLYDIQLKVGKNHPYTKNGRVEVHRLIYEARINNLSFLDYLDILLNEPIKSKNLKFIDTLTYEIHHKDGFHYNNSIENLELVKKDEHRLIHNSYNNFSQGLPNFSKILNIKELGEEKTYDIECEEPYHNFVANGIVVHNSGKSWLGFQIGKYIDPTLSLSRITFNAETFRQAIYKAKKGEVIVYDEAFTGLSSRSSLSGINRALVGLMMQMRQKNLCIILVLPTFYLLDKYAALFRSRVLIHVYENHGIRGYFRLYNSKLKKTLYLMGRKDYSYHVRTRFKGRFYGKFALGDETIEKEYRKLKAKALEETEKNPMTAGQVKYMEQRNILIYLIRKFTGLGYEHLSNWFDDYDLSMSHNQIKEICAKFGDKGKITIGKHQNLVRNVFKDKFILDLADKIRKTEQETPKNDESHGEVNISDGEIGENQGVDMDSDDF